MYALLPTPYALLMLIIPISSTLHHHLSQLAQTKRMVFMAGLQGTGKSLLIQQLVLIAQEAGRTVHLLQWLTARQPFETPEILVRYPETDGVTHPVIRWATGVWVRGAVARWHEQHPDPRHLLIGELPVIGNRLLELTQPEADGLEPLLTSEQVQFVLPVPSWEVRAAIEDARARTLADPQHEREKRDASPAVLQALWQEVNGLARQMGLTKASPTTPYNPYIYGGVFQALLQHRHLQTLLVDEVLHPQRSVYELAQIASELQATPAEVAAIMARVEEQGVDRVETAVSHWHYPLTQNPQPPDPGPELPLPLPEALPYAEQNTELTAEQRAALQVVVRLPLQAEVGVVLTAVDHALHTLAPVTVPTAAHVHKFDVYDSYFNVQRRDGDPGLLFLGGLLQAYRNALQNLDGDPTLTVIEKPMLRIALEAAVGMFV